MDKCSHEGCNLPTRCKGYCKTHYYRVKRHGDSNACARFFWTDKNCKELYHAAKRLAENNGMDFNIRPESIVIPDVCPVLGITLKKGTKTTIDGSPSLDRIDNSKRYVEGNVIVVSYLANRIKTNATPEQIIKVGTFFERVQREASSKRASGEDGVICDQHHAAKVFKN